MSGSWQIESARIERNRVFIYTQSGLYPTTRVSLFEQLGPGLGITPVVLAREGELYRPEPISLPIGELVKLPSDEARFGFRTYDERSVPYGHAYVRLVGIKPSLPSFREAVRQLEQAQLPL